MIHSVSNKIELLFITAEQTNELSMFMIKFSNEFEC